MNGAPAVRPASIIRETAHDMVPSAVTRDFVLCDVFAEKPFTGNQLAVVLDGDGLSDAEMLALAREFGWSEVTFVLEGNPPRVRIWTVDGELPFAGHPTVGTAVVLAASGRPASELELGIGPVTVDVALHGRDEGVCTMTQRPPAFGAVYENRERLARAHSLQPDDLNSDLPVQVVSTGLPHLMVPLRSLDALSRAVPDTALYGDVLTDLKEAIGFEGQWLYLFYPYPDGEMAARTRLLGVGMDDPATGSAAGPLGSYLVHYGLHAPGEMTIEQGIEVGRPSRLDVNVPVENGAIGAVQVRGTVHIWARGTWL